MSNYYSFNNQSVSRGITSKMASQNCVRCPSCSHHFEPSQSAPSTNVNTMPLQPAPSQPSAQAPAPTTPTQPVTTTTALMTADDLISDASLIAVLSAADQARQQSEALLTLLSGHPRSTPDSKLAAAAEPALSAAQKTLHAHLAQVRHLNRAALRSVRATKAATADARHEVDTLHLQLQNLYYEQRHLRGEIAACEAYEHAYQRLPLIPVDEFVVRFPEAAERARARGQRGEEGDEEGDEEDRLMVARIEQEHAERQALEEKRQGLLKRKQGLIAENKKRKEDLANLDKDLEKFIEAAKPIEQTFQKEY